ncbi:SDR family oxidoreductase [Glaciimonas sp. GG7]
MNDLILITGATGFLGGAVAVDAMQRGLTKRLLLLARGSDPESAMARLRTNLLALGASDADLAQLSLQQILNCDLNTLSGVGSDLRLEQVAQVIHCAALATFSAHPALYQVNVDGTMALATLMYGRPALKRFIYVGTAMACGEQSTVQRHIKERHLACATKDAHVVPYTYSKALAETLLMERFPDLPLVLARPSIIVGHTRLGCAPSQSIFWVFRVWQLLGVTTASMGDRIDVVPVDWCASALVDLALKESLSHSVFHLSAGVQSSKTFWHIDRALTVGGSGRTGDYDYEHIDPEHMERLLPSIRMRLPDCNARLLVRALKLYGEFARLGYVFDNRHLLAEGVSAAPPFTTYAARCVTSTVGIPIQSQMMCDFK